MFFSLLLLVLAFISLIVLMVIHEFGHFIIAKKFGVRVDEFGIGYPPRIFGKKVGETIYSVNWVPLGAFVRIHGEEGGVDEYRSFSNLKIWKRVSIVVGGVVAFWIAAIIIFSVVFMMGTDLPVGDQDVSGLTNARIKIIAVGQNSPADKAGLKAGDTLTFVGSAITQIPADGQILNVEPTVTKLEKIKDFQDFIKEQAGKSVVLRVDRNGKDFDATLTPRINPPAGEGATGVVLERMATLVEKTAWYQAPIKGTVYTWDTTIKALQGLYVTFRDMFTGKGVPEGASFAGPIGITVFLANAASYGIGFFLYFIGMISVFVAIFNLFPIPALDGGKLIFLIIEKIKGKPVSVKVEQTITVIFFAILISLSLFITVRFDIPRIFDYIKSSL